LGIHAQRCRTKLALRNERHNADQIANSGIYDQPKPAGYERELLEIVQRGREQGRRVGDQ